VDAGDVDGLYNKTTLFRGRFPMIASIALSAVLWPAAISKACDPPANVIIVGVAVDKHQEFLYCEHFVKTDDTHVQVSYVRDGVVFVKKDLDFSVSHTSPSVKQIDQRSGELREASTDEKNVTLIYKKNRTSAIEKTSLTRDSIDALDAGFNSLILINWDKLIAGYILPIHFGSIAHQKNLALRIKQAPSEQCNNGSNSHDKQELSCFSVEIDNFLLRLLIGGISLTYDKQRRLHEFNGTVNIEDDKQKAMSAHIRYYYRNDYPANSTQ
jgi:hypothetical protein